MMYSVILYIVFLRVKDTIVNTVGHRQAEHLLCLGKLLTSAEAKNIGLVDCVVNKDDVISEAKKELQKWLAIPGMILL